MKRMKKTTSLDEAQSPTVIECGCACFPRCFQIASVGDAADEHDPGVLTIVAATDRLLG